MRQRDQDPPARPGRVGAASAWTSPAASRTVEDTVEGAINWIRLACVLSLVVYGVLPGIPGTGRGPRLAIDVVVLLFYPLIMAVGLRPPRTRAHLPSVATIVDPRFITALVAQTAGLASELYRVFFP